jgi:hypothetical protein
MCRVDELRGCSLRVICVTPESLRSQWMLFEAEALAQHGPVFPGT